MSLCELNIKLSSIQALWSALVSDYILARIPSFEKKKNPLSRNLLKFLFFTLMVTGSLMPPIEPQCPCSNTAASMGFYHTDHPLLTPLPPHHPSHPHWYKDMHSCCPVAQKLNVI